VNASEAQTAEHPYFTRQQLNIII